ncbi:hypothetical protein CC1G_15428 [Coprinopsis cinerea okayama7|uniref:Amine oxidase domain-containing protein n=1 Tax=Coprinopsis cinerea (strain Okayama-7 / 130 / ATCC MYA-4618 / FGSC 9003) TaxID=240176 RepID=D6RQN1_COPC7|nr:hypothetical protein CC1G_15428 [Coprinopsis cinerea okayama7\|eukprot:XP_002910151.1 hypothetical protein CC1G_15428 [Coprinopsis cinerea okayama7\
MTLDALNILSSESQGDVFAHYARNLLKALQKPDMPLRVPATERKIPQFDVKTTHDGVVPVGIIGGGMAGLYAGLMLAYQGISFQILEATDRIGGRCYTYKFEEGGDYDYYDVGAMRFPLPRKGEKNPHTRLAKLFELLGLDLLDYIFTTNEGRLYYDGVYAKIGDTNPSFRAEQLGVSKCYIDCGYKALCRDIIDPLAKYLLDDMNTGSDAGWKEFKKKYDRYSTRSYLQFEYKPSKALQDKFHIPDEHLPTAVIDWLETHDKSSGWYDRALSETVLEALAFGDVDGGPKPEWHCIDRGTSVLPERSLAMIKEWLKNASESQFLVKKAPVTSIRPADPEDTKSPLVVTAGGKDYTFSHVISTVPLPNFALIDTSSLNLSPMQSNAIRQLQYGPSIKIGIHFKSAWWKERGQVGGQSFTDLPIRTIVYPSYGKGQSSKVLIASYCWTNDAGRLGNLINAGEDDLLRDVVLRDLATVHQVGFDYLKGQCERVHAFNWNHNAWSGGAFAFFGPGQYEYLYGALNDVAADGRLQWAGELLSIRHAWIVGALDSAWAAIHRYLCLSNASDKQLKKFYDKWGANLEWHAAGDKVTQNRGEDKSDPGEELTIPRSKNLLLRHLEIYNPDLVVYSD